MTKGEWAGVFTAVAGAALAAQAVASAARGAASAFREAPLVKLGCDAGAAAIALVIWSAGEDDAGSSRRA
jgi:hypothetical protein